MKLAMEFWALEFWALEFGTMGFGAMEFGAWIWGYGTMGLVPPPHFPNLLPTDDYFFSCLKNLRMRPRAVSPCFIISLVLGLRVCTTTA